MTDEQRKRIHDIEYSCDSRAELGERIVALEDERDKLKNNNNYLREMLSESRQANERLYTDLKRHKSILRTRPNAMTALYDENAKLRELATETIRLMQADGPDCGLCKHYDECWAGEATNYSPSGCVICNEARELGLEVK